MSEFELLAQDLLEKAEAEEQLRQENDKKLLGQVLGQVAHPGVQLEGRGEEAPGGAHPLPEEGNRGETPQRAQSRGFVAQQRQTPCSRGQGGSQGLDDARGEVGARAWVVGGAGRYGRR